MWEREAYIDFVSFIFSFFLSLSSLFLFCFSSKADVSFYTFFPLFFVHLLWSGLCLYVGTFCLAGGPDIL